MILSDKQLCGLDDSHISYVRGIGLAPACWEALARLSLAAKQAGFDIQVASGFRSFERQLAIWNAKATGERGVHDDRGEPVPMDTLDDAGKVHAILRYSALPGGSRHHWGSDLDVFDGNARPEGYQLQLTPAEVADDGMFGAFHRWLDERIQRDEAEGFYRPYATDRGGVAPERWHLSYAPLSQPCAVGLSEDLLARTLAASELALRDTVLSQLPALYQRYVAVPSPL